MHIVVRRNFGTVYVGKMPQHALIKRHFHAGFKPLASGIEVPYFTCLPQGSSGNGPTPTLFGKSSAPINSTCFPLKLFSETPAIKSKSRNNTPFHTFVLTPPDPQLNPIVCRIMFCSFRLFPAQTSVTGSSLASIDASSSMLILKGFFTNGPPISIL